MMNTPAINKDDRLAKAIGEDTLAALKIAQDVVDLLSAKGLYITVVESCTGGALAGMITNISGSSEVLKDGFITYSNQAKIALGVSGDTLEKYSVYSAETAIAMARAGISRSVQADIGVGITGSLTRTDPTNHNSVPGEVYIGIVMGDVEVGHMLTVPETNRVEAKLYIVGHTLKAVNTVLS